MMENYNKLIAPEITQDSQLVERINNTTITAPVAKDYMPRKRRAITELPAEGKTQTLINTVLIYTLMGLTPNEISMALKCTITDIKYIIDLPTYQETFDILFYELISANSKSLQARIASYAGSAVQNVMDLADAEIGDKRVPAIVKLKSNQDLLDRAGLSAETLFGDGAADDDSNTLNIIITDEESSRDVNIDVGFTDED